MIPDVVDDVQSRLERALPESATQLLEPDDFRLRRTQHHHRVNLWNIQSFVEHVHREEHLELSLGELSQAFRSWCRVRTAVNRRHANPSLAKKVRHEIGVAPGYAEAQCALSTAFSPLFQGILRSSLGGNGGGQGFLIEPAAAPGNLRVVDVIGNPEVMERSQQMPGYALHEITVIGNRAVAEPQEICPVCPFGCGGEPEQEAWTEPVQDAPVSRSRRVVEFVDDDIVERLGIKRLETLPLAESLDRGEEDVDGNILPVPREETEFSCRANLREGLPSLLEDFLAMRHEQDASKLGTTGIES